MESVSLRHNPYGQFPKVHHSAFIDATALIIGNVTIGKNVFIGPGAVIRADEKGSAITIKDNCNIQDNVILHALSGSSVEIGAYSSLSHGCIVHGPCIIGKHCFIGFGSVVFSSVLKDNVAVKHLAVVEGVKIPAKRIVSSKSFVDTPEKVDALPAVPADMAAFTRQVVNTNITLTHAYRGFKSPL